MRIHTLIVGLVCSVLLSLPFGLGYRPETLPFAFEAELTSTSFVHAQVYFDAGRGLNEADSARIPVQAGETFSRVRFPLRAGIYRGFRFDPADRQATITVRHARIVDEHGREYHAFEPGDFTPLQHITNVTTDEGTLTIVTASGQEDPNLALRLDDPLVLEHSEFWDRWGWRAFACAAAWLVLAGAVMILPRSWRTRFGERATRLTRILQRHPGASICCAAVIAVVASSYPVVFLGKSYVSPNFSDGTYLLYGRFPTLPGYDSAVTEDARGSDVGAIIWQHVPYAMMQRAALADGDLPLWNRYNSCGSVLFAQGQSMFGDPIHSIVLLGGGTAWSWDLKYLAAKWLLSAFLGLIVWQGTRHLGTALLTAASSVFIGFFLFRVNHPAFFSFCYAPAILYCWTRFSETHTPRARAGWAAALVAANWAELHSGTVKEAYMLLLGMNFTGLVVTLYSPRPWHERVRLILGAVWAGIIFILLAAPTWLTFLDTLKSARTSYDVPMAFQISPSYALGLFDEIFYRPILLAERVANPSANFLVLAGVLYFVVGYREAASSRFARAIAASALVPIALVFGLVPPQWIASVPFIGNVGHIDNTFSCILIVQLIVLAGFGWRAAFERLARPEGRADLQKLGILYVLLLFPWIAYHHVVHRPTFGNAEVVSLLHWGERVAVSDVVWWSLLALTLASVVLLLSARSWLRYRRLSGPVLLGIIMSITVLLWRHGVHAAPVGPSDYVFAPGVRASFPAESPAISAIQSDRSGPTRVVGLYNNLMPGWTGVQSVESISGPDGIQNRSYQELIRALNLEVIWNWRVYVTAENLAQSKVALDFLNVGYYVDSGNDLARLAPDLTPVAHKDLDVYRSETAWPRAFFASGVVSYESPEELNALISNAHGRPFAAIHSHDLQTSPLAARFVTSEPAATVTAASDYQLKNHTTTFTIDASGPGVAVLHETWLPDDFIAILNGERVPYLRMNHAFKGVLIPRAGTHVVEFSYRPRRFSSALILAAVGACAAVASLLVALMASRKFERASTG